MYTKRLGGLLTILILTATSANVWSAFDFIPTELEYMAWPDYCKVVYSRTNVGQSQRRMRPTAAETATGAPLLGEAMFGTGGVHHFCAGQAWFQRSQIEFDSRQKETKLNRAEQETAYTLNRISLNDPLYVRVHIQMAQILQAKNDFVEAISLLDKLISEVPGDASAYSLKGVMYYKQGDVDEAIRVLVKADQHLMGKSAEIHYNLGLILSTKGDWHGALEHGRQAYDLGYPLQGLRRKLQRAGVWANDS